MRKTIIPNKLNHNPQIHARVCEENKKELELEKRNLVKCFAVKDWLWKPVEGCDATDWNKFQYKDSS